MRRNITQPDDWWAAFLAAAERDGQTLSEWIGVQCRKGLSRSADKRLTDRPPAHRPRRSRGNHRSQS